MNSPQIRLVASAVLVVLGIVLLTVGTKGQSQSALPAANPDPSCSTNHWPPHNQDEKLEVADAFNKALKDAGVPDASGGPGPLRKALLNRANNYSEPRTKMRDKLKEVHPNHPNSKVEFPDDLAIIFYEEETDKKVPRPPTAEQAKKLRTVAGEHPNHCYIVVYMEPLAGGNAKGPSFQDQMVCCYEPY